MELPITPNQPTSEEVPNAPRKRRLHKRIRVRPIPCLLDEANIQENQENLENPDYLLDPENFQTPINSPREKMSCPGAPKRKKIE